MAQQVIGNSSCRLSTSVCVRFWPTAAAFLLLLGACKPSDNSLRTLDAGAGPIYALALTPDTRFIALGTASRDVRLFDLRLGSEVAVLTGYESIVRAVTFTGDGSVLFGAGIDIRGEKSTVHGWEMGAIARKGIVATTGKRSSRKLPEPPPLVTFFTQGQVKSLAVSPSGELIAVLSGRSVSLFHWSNSRAKLRRSFVPFTRESFALAVSPDGRALVVCGVDRGQQNSTVKNQAGIATSGYVTLLKTFDTETGQKLTTRPVVAESVRGLLFSPNGEMLAVGCNGKSHGSVAIWNAREPAPSPHVLTVSGQVGALAFSPDSRQLAVAAMSAIEVWDTATLARRSLLRGHQDQVNAIQFEPNGETFLSAGYDGCIKVWQAESSNPVRR